MPRAFFKLILELGQSLLQGCTVLLQVGNADVLVLRHGAEDVEDVGADDAPLTRRQP